MKSSQPRGLRVECRNCGSTFNNYTTTHEKNKRDRKYVNIKIVGAPANPFAACTSNQGHSVGGQLGKLVKH